MAAGTPVLPGGNNTYVESFGGGSDKLVVGFSRNPTKFALNQYVQIRDVQLKSGFYLRINTEEAGRVLDSDLSEHIWPDAVDRPQNNDGTESFSFHDFRTQRYAFNWKLGQDSIDQAAWDVVGSHEAIKAQQAMTARTQRVHSILNTAANWEATHTKDVTTIAGVQGPWDASTNSRLDIQRSLDFAADVILKSTLGVVVKSDLRLVMNPTTARAVSRTQEIREHVAGSPFVMKQIEQVDMFDQYGLPSYLYGYRTLVEHTVKVTSRRGAATPTRGYVMPDGVAYLLARPGGLVAPPGGGPSFSTVSLFMKEDMTTQTDEDDWNRRTKGSVVDDYAPVITASASGFRFTGVLT